MTEFKVGDKVTHNIRGKAEVTYGPYTDTFGRTYNVIRLESGREMSVPADALTALPAFAVGDKAKMDGEREPVEILAGPYKNRYITWYTVRAEVGDTTAAEDNLTALPAPEPIKVGDRVKVVVADPTIPGMSANFDGRTGVVERIATGRPDTPYLVKFGPGFHGDTNGKWFCKSVEKVVDEPAKTYTYEGITYDLSAKYRDKDGDVWTFDSSASAADADPVMVTAWDSTNNLKEVVHLWGPLRKI